MTAEPLVYRYSSSDHERWLILDRDGTLTRDEGYTHRIVDFELMPGVLDALQRLSTVGWGFAIATNQGGIARGHFTIQDMEDFNAHLVAHLRDRGVQISCLVACPHHPDGRIPEFSRSCLCRKPGVGSLTRLQAELGLAIDGMVDGSWTAGALRASRVAFVGNSEIDRLAAASAGLPYFWGRTPLDWSKVVERLTGES